MHKDIVVSLEMLQKGIISVKEEVSEVKKEVSEVKKEVSEVKKEVSEVKKEVSEVKKEVSEVKKEVGKVEKQVILTSVDINERLDPIAYSAVEVNKSMPCRLGSFVYEIVLTCVTEAVEDRTGSDNLRWRLFESCVYSKPTF